MSMMRCEHCDRLVDTDFDLEGIWTTNFGYICEACTEQMAEDVEERAHQGEAA